MSRTRAFPPFSAQRPRRFARAEVQPGAEVASSGLSTNHPSAAKPTIKPPRHSSREGTPTRRPLGDVPSHAWGIPRHARKTKAQLLRDARRSTGPRPEPMDALLNTPGFASLCNCGKLSRKGRRAVLGFSRGTGPRPTAATQLEPRVWPCRAIRNHHRHPRRCKTPAARHAAGALLGEAMIDPAAGVQTQLLWTETWFCRPCRLFGRHKWSHPIVMRLG